MAEEIPLAVVGVTFRTMAGTDRARLAQAALTDGKPWQSLQEHGNLRGLVRVETCSRVEWLLSSPTPQWAGELFRASLARVLTPDAVLHGSHLRAGDTGVAYLFRVVAGLDSVAEGEAAVGRQVLRAFELAHDAGHTDPVLHALWRHSTALVMSRRECHGLQDPTGVQNLVLEELTRAGVRPEDGPATLLGRGAMGKALRHAMLRFGYAEPPRYGRAELKTFLAECATARLACVATAGPEAWLDLPAREDQPVLVDVSCPVQIRAAPGWKLVTLDDLLASEARRLPEQARHWLEERVRVTIEAALHDLRHPKPADLLRDLDSARKAFMDETLPKVLDGLPDTVSANIRREFSRYAHDVLRKARSL